MQPPRTGATARRCTGWTSRAAASQLAREAVEEAGAHGRVRARLQHQRRRRQPERARETHPAAAARVRGRPARPHPARDALAGPRPARPTPPSRRSWRPGIPVWLSFRRCRHGVCGVYGQHWGGPEGDAFGRAARRFEEMGVRALLINCLPPDHVPGCSRGCATSPTCRSASIRTSATTRPTAGASTRPSAATSTPSMAPPGARRAPRSSAAAAARGPSTSPAARERVRDMPPGRAAARRGRRRRGRRRAGLAAAPASPRRGRGPTQRGRRLFPLELPEIVCEPGVFVPTQGSFLVWKYLFRSGIGAGQRCLDVGCGTGPARRSSWRATAPSTCTRSTSTSAPSPTRSPTRSATASPTASPARPSTSTRGCPKERYDVVVASLYQMPVDPFEQPTPTGRSTTGAATCSTT